MGVMWSMQCRYTGDSRGKTSVFMVDDEFHAQQNVCVSGHIVADWQWRAVYFNGLSLLITEVRIHPRTWYSTHSATRSEEHTSELQSHVNLVCRLLLEK